MPYSRIQHKLLYPLGSELCTACNNNQHHQTLGYQRNMHGMHSRFLSAPTMVEKSWVSTHACTNIQSCLQITSTKASPTIHFHLNNLAQSPQTSHINQYQPPLISPKSLKYASPQNGKTGKTGKGPTPECSKTQQLAPNVDTSTQLYYSPLIPKDRRRNPAQLSRIMQARHKRQ